MQSEQIQKKLDEAKAELKLCLKRKKELEEQTQLNDERIRFYYGSVFRPNSGEVYRLEVELEQSKQLAAANGAPLVRAKMFDWSRDWDAYLFVKATPKLIFLKRDPKSRNDQFRREKIHPDDLALIDAKQLYKLPKYKPEAEEAANGN